MEKNASCHQTFQADDTASYTCTAINVAGRDSMDRVLRIQGRAN